MDNKGYIYTLITVMLILIIISLISYYIVISTPSVGDVVARIRTDELYYFVESVKMDYDRSISVSGQRAFAYLIDYSMGKRVFFDGYVMRNCTDFNYDVNGSQAAAVELMLCGTLYGSKMPKDFMENQTILNWVDRITAKGDEMNFIVEARPREIKIIPYDSRNFFIVSKLDLIVYDKLNESFYRGYNMPVVSKINIDNMEDPTYPVRTGSHDLIRYFTPCEPYSEVNATTVEVWVDSECYNAEGNSPSFFDRLDGSLNRSEKYVQQSRDVEKLGLTQQVIGLESFVDLDKLASHNLTVNYNNSWVDYYYWNDISAYCSITGLGKHKNLKVDFYHADKYSIKGLNCSITVENSFTPGWLAFPVNSTVTWLNANVAESCILDVNAQGWQEVELAPGEQYSWLFNETGTYTMSCTLSQSGFEFSGAILV
ncbi:MAG: hypothetical protein FJY77_03905 [Candidatus Altiarchaeales archaeon]|nr:hypothetical protein [Candidatus Altiarchaeales archaeon]